MVSDQSCLLPENWAPAGQYSWVSVEVWVRGWQDCPQTPSLGWSSSGSVCVGSSG